MKKKQIIIKSFSVMLGISTWHVIVPAYVLSWQRRKKNNVRFEFRGLEVDNVGSSFVVYDKKYLKLFCSRFHCDIVNCYLIDNWNNVCSQTLSNSPYEYIMFYTIFFYVESLQNFMYPNIILYVILLKTTRITETFYLSLGLQVMFFL